MVTGKSLPALNRGGRAFWLVAMVAGILALPATGFAASTATRYALAAHGFFELSVPTGWNAQVDPAAQPLHISFGQSNQPPFIVSLAPVWKAAADRRALTPKALRAEVAHMADAIRLFAVEKDLKLVALAGAAGSGYYFFATDSAPASGGYKFMHRGLLKVGDLALTFTILTNEGQDAVARHALDMLKSARHVPR